MECHSDHLRIIESSVRSEALVLRSLQFLVENHLYLSFLRTDSPSGLLYLSHLYITTELNNFRERFPSDFENARAAKSQLRTRCLESCHVAQSREGKMVEGKLKGNIGEPGSRAGK